MKQALDGHPEVTLERVRAALKRPNRVIQSKKNNRVCLFYNLELTDHPVFGSIYFCVVVSVLKDGKGKMETAYETTYIKVGKILYQKDSK